MELPVLDLTRYLTTCYIEPYVRHITYKTRPTKCETGVICRSVFDRKKENWFEIPGDFIKSSLMSDEFDGGVYLMNDEIPYIHRVYENLNDSNGNIHRVQVSYEEKKIRLTDDMFEVRDLSSGYIVSEIKDKCPIDNDKLYFQFNLKQYVLVYWAKGVSDMDYFKRIIHNKYNETPEQFRSDSYKNREAMESSGFYPFFEICYGHQTNYIPDSIFFNYPNRKLALDRIRCGAESIYRDKKTNVFSDFDYINATDNELVKFMNDRFKKRIKFENLIKN